jgi:uncharacterized protein
MGDGDLPEHIAHAVTNRGLKLILNPTEQCNLRCTYCYESFVLRRMPADVINGILRLVERRASTGLDWLEIELFGGEPLAAWRVVETLSCELHRICTQYNVQLSGALTTNATLLDQSRLDTLVQNRFQSFQITIDGPEHVHNLRRITSAGVGTFKTIWHRLLMLKASSYDIDVVLRLHYDRTTLDALIQGHSFFDDLASTFFVGDKRFRLHLNPLEPWAGTKPADISFFSNYKERLAARERLLERAIDAGISAAQLPQYRAALPTGESGHVVCYAARANAFVIRSNGRVSKCTVAFEDERNVVGRINPNGELVIDHDRHLPWLRGLVSGSGDALQCPAVGLIWT